MTFLPVVERELRVAARKRSTFWLRIVAALTALVIGSGFLVLTVAGIGFGPAGLGRGLFAALTWLCLAAALSAGLFFTSDCLSEEKREGTLGFLFLTDLRGYDVVLGKLVATSLRGFYAFLAVVPILAITLLMGGVTGAQFWKTSLALVNAMFISLAAGLLVSALSRDSQQALAGTLLLLLALVGSGPVGDAIVAALRLASFNPVLSLSSPGYLFVTANTWSKRDFLAGLLVNQTIGWALLGLAAVLLPRSWQEKAGRTSPGKGNWAYWWKFGGIKHRARLRGRLLGVNPVLWLACRERWQAILFKAMTVLMAGGVAAMLAGGQHSIWWFAWSYIGGLFQLALYLGIASQSGRFLIEARRSGLMELLLATPLTARAIVQGQWRALLRMFGPALVLFVAAQLLGTFMNQKVTWKQAGITAPLPPAPPATNGVSLTSTTTATITIATSASTSLTLSTGAYPGPSSLVMLGISVAGTLTVVANLTALVWFGMWMGLTSRSTNLATLKTVVLVQVVPWVVVSFASALLVPLLLLPNLLRGVASGAPATMAWFPLVFSGVGTVLSLGKDVGFCLWARKKLYSEFRERAARMVVPMNLPPVIA